MSRIFACRSARGYGAISATSEREVEEYLEEHILHDN